MASKISFGESNSGLQEGINDGSVRFLPPEAPLNQACLRDLRTTSPHDDKDRIEKSNGGLLKDSYCWILDNQQFKQWRDNQNNHLLWIRGDPGKGKTMLLCGIIDELTRSIGDVANISFFFCQATDGRINHATAVIRGLIYSLVEKQPSLLSYVESRYDKAGKALFEDINAWSALSKIFVDILKDPTLQDTYLVIDALDECTIDLPFLLDLIVQQSNAYAQVKWIVSSRNWPDIKERLDTAAQIAPISLELNEASVSEAVSKFIHHRVHHLAHVKRYNDKTRDEICHHLSLNSQGTFLWVALVCQELNRTSRWHALKKLKVLPAGLNALFWRMLTQITTSDDAEPCQSVLQTVIAAYSPLHLEELSALSGLPRDTWSKHESVAEIVSMCGSFLTIRNDSVYTIHRSAKEFLSTGISLFPFGIEEKHYDMFSRSLLAMSSTLQRDLYRLRSPVSPIGQVNQPNPDPLAAARYSCIHWVDHLSDGYSFVRARDNVLQDGGMVDQFLGRKYLNWLEALSLLRSVSEGIRLMAKLEGLLQRGKETSQLTDLVRDARRFILYHKWEIENSPLQVYALALTFSPARGTIDLFKQEELKQITEKSAVEDGRDMFLQQLEGHRSWVDSVAFSHDLKQIVSASNDRTVKIWDATAGICLQTLTGHRDWVNSVAFSHDSKQIVSASNDRTVKIWDATAGICLQTLKGHRDWVNSVAFSHDSKQIVSASYDRTAKIWEVITGKCLQTLQGHSESVYSAAFSQDSKQAMSASGERIVKVWDTATGKCLQTLEGNSEPVISVAFSPDGKLLASSSTNGMVQLWYADKGTSKQGQGKSFVNPRTVSGAEDSWITNATSGLPPDEQDEQASTTETSNALWSYQAGSTNPSSVSYEAAMDMGQVTESRSSMTFFSYRKAEIGHRPHKSDDDIQSVKSIPDDIESLAESNSRLANYQQAAVNYIVKMFTGDQELFGLYQEATQLMNEAKFVRNHQRLLKTLFLDLRSEGHSPSQSLAVGFLRSRSTRIHISSAIRSLIIPSDYTIREKINIMLEQEKDSLFLLDRLLDERDCTVQPTPKNTADETFGGKPTIKVPVSDNSDTAREDSGESDEDNDIRSDESETEIQKDNPLSKLEAAAEFLTTGRPFGLYKENLRGFLHPLHEADNLQENLQREVAQTYSLFPQQSISNSIKAEQGDVIGSGNSEVQACDTSQLKHNLDNHTREQSRSLLQNLRRGLRNSLRLDAREKSDKFLHSLPLLVDQVLQSLPLPESEPPIPKGKVRARWNCRCGVRLFDDFTELESGSVKELEIELQELGRSTQRTRNLWKSIFEGFGVLSKPTEHGLQKQRPSNSHRGNVLPLEEIRQPPNALHRSNDAQRPNRPDAKCQDTLHLLICVDKRKYGTPLHQEHLNGVSTDRELFLFLRSKYFGHWNVRNWFTLRNIGSLSLSRYKNRFAKSSKFAVDFSNFAEVHKHISTCGPACVCLPPVDKLDREYHCRPAPEVKPKYEPVIGTQRLTHYFLSPQCVKVTQKTILAQLPKRVGHLSATSDQEEIGWGIHFQEGWHWRTVNFVVVVLVASSSLIFGIVWSIMKGDIQGAFAISSFWLTLGSLLLAYIAFSTNSIRNIIFEQDGDANVMFRLFVLFIEKFLYGNVFHG